MPKPVKAEMIAYYYGQDARLEDKPFDSNPYPENTFLHNAWNDGWLETDDILTNGEEE